MKRAAIYARFSSDLQSDKSIDDQVALCRDVAKREGMIVVATFHDRAISGSSAINRPGFQAMMRAAEAREFDSLIAEDIDRISRDQADYHAARKRLDFLAISIHTANGKVTRIDGALRALMGEMFIENLVLHTRRGMEGVVRDGRHAGGRAYGYRTIPGKPGELEIADHEAAIVREIFEAFVAGLPPRDIAKRLNDRRVPPPRGDRWNASTINGNMQRGAGILLNEIYVGRIVWNKVRMIKDPATGKRISRPNPIEQHKVADAPHLRILDDATFTAAQLRKRPAATERAMMPARRPRVFSGLLKCSRCGGGMVSSGHRFATARLQCSRFIESGSCSNGRRIKRDDVERLAIAALKTELASPAVIAEYVKAYNAERQRLRRISSDERSRLERRNGEIGRELQRAIDAIVKHGVDASTLAPQIKALEAERSDISTKLAAADDGHKVVALHPATVQRYLADVARLEALSDRSTTDERDDVHARIRNLVETVIVDAPPHSQDLSIEVRGRLAELLDLPRLSVRSTGGERMVAGEGLEPPTPGL